MSIDKKDKKITKWLENQKGYAKFAWSVVMVIAAVFGYQVSVEKTISNEPFTNAVTEEVLKRLDLIQKNINELEKITELQNNIALQQENHDHKQGYENFLDKLEK